MGLAIASFAKRFFSPAAAGPLVREPNRRWSRPSARQSLLRLPVVDILRETPSTKTFVLDDRALTYHAGQHLTLVAEIGGRSERRCYSLSTPPSGGVRPAITVKRVEGGVLSCWLHDEVKVGDVLRAAPAAGRFTIETAASLARHVALVAGGVGITPLFSMAATLLQGEKDSRVTLLYGSRSEDEIIFRAKLERMQEQFGSRFDVLLAVDEAREGWNGLVGAWSGDRVLEQTRRLGIEDWYLCGPEAMMNSVSAALAGSGIAADRVHLERFQYAEAATARKPKTSGTLVFAASGRSATAAAGATLLEAAEAAGVALPSSCRMGGCGACKIKVEGRVLAAEPNCLTEAERSDGFALACCSWGDGRVVIRDF